MNDKTMVSTLIVHTLVFGITFFLIGMIADDLYIVIGGALLIILGAIIGTGEKVIQHTRHQPKGL